MSQSSRLWTGTGGRLVRSVLLAALLIPVTILFTQVRQDAADKESFAERERHGVAYLSVLWRLTLAVTDAQSAAVAGRAPAGDAVARAVRATGEVDERLGDELRTHERWAALRAKIEALPGRDLADPAAAYAAYTEVTDLVLALFGKVRENSELIRDPDADAYYLEDAGAEELPEAVVAAGRLADLAVLAPTRPAADRTTTIAELTVAHSEVTDPAVDLTEDLRSAVDGTESRTLSGNLLSRLDLFQRGMDNLTAVSAPDQSRLMPDPGPVSTARAAMQDAAADLGETIFTELDGLIANRIDDVNGEQRRTLVTLLLAVLLVVVPILAMFVRIRPRTGLPPSAVVNREPSPVVDRERERTGVAAR